jgi:hypothetical protein
MLDGAPGRSSSVPAGLNAVLDEMDLRYPDHHTKGDFHIQAARVRMKKLGAAGLATEASRLLQSLWQDSSEAAQSLRQQVGSGNAMTPVRQLAMPPDCFEVPEQRCVCSLLLA